MEVHRRGFLLTSMFGGLSAIFGSKPAAAGDTRAKLVTIVQFSASGARGEIQQVEKVVKSDAEWRRLLPAIAYEVARREGTERPFTGATWNSHERGIYRCVCCDTALFDSETKFESGTGWPSFWQPLDRRNVTERADLSLGMERTAVECKRCDAHLGHVFDDGPRPTGLRYCMNSAAMTFVRA